jgi:predicted glycoside hydrolase/deacetylase ChbG (UPF0249 family)
MNPTKSRLIINADDFGYSHRTNQAIVAAFERGLCSSCTLMANMPGFDEACELVHQCGLTANVGMHLTLTEGAPVTERIRQCSRFCDQQGRFRLSPRQRVFHLDANERRALIEEIQGQIARCRQRGIPLTHVDSHKHVHQEWAIVPLLIRAARDAGIPYVRRCKTFGFGASGVKTFYRRVVNRRLHQAGLTRTDYFGAPDDYMLFWCRFEGGQSFAASWEVMIHPSFDADGNLVDSWLERSIEDMVRDLAGYEHARSYIGSRIPERIRTLEYAIP